MLKREDLAKAMNLSRQLNEICDMIEENSKGMIHITIQRRTGETLKAEDVMEFIGEGAYGNLIDDLRQHLDDAKKFYEDKLKELGVEP